MLLVRPQLGLYFRDESRLRRPMKMHSSWRCKGDMPMLDDEEFNRVSSQFNTGTQGDSSGRMFRPCPANMNALRASDRQIRILSSITYYLYKGRPVPIAESRWEPRMQRC